MKVKLPFFVVFLKNLLILLFGSVVFYFGTVTVLTLLYVNVDPPLTTLMVLRSFQGVKVGPAKPIPLKKIPAFARNGIIYLEDHQFWTHHGIVWEAVQEAWETNKKAGKLERGGSTITQQLARNLFLFPDRMYLRKGLEAGTALLLEKFLTKDRILELYLNHIEWGPGVFGIEAGSRYQFGTGIRNLSTEQMARLEAIITNPIVLSVKTYYKNRGMAARYEALMNW